MPETVTLIVTIHAKPEHSQTVRTLLLELAAKTSREEGSLFYLVHEVAKDPQQFIIYEKWRNQAALDSHMSEDYLLAFLAREDELLSRKIEGKFCTLISTREGR